MSRKNFLILDMYTWWLLILMGIFLIVVLKVDVKKKQIPDNDIDKIPKSKIKAYFILGIILIVAGAAGAFIPKIIRYSSFALNARTGVLDIHEIFLTLLTQFALVIGSVNGLYKTIVKKNRSDLYASIFCILLLLCCWTWVLFTNRFTEIYVDPFINLYRLIFK